MKLHFTVHASMVGRIDRCLLVWYRVPLETAQPLTPAGLELITHEHRGRRWAFMNAVFCRIEAMRPAWMPAGLGVTYHHVACRLSVRASTAEGELSGLYFLRSDVDDGMVALGGELVSDFRFHKATISSELTAARFQIHVDGPDPEAKAVVDADLAGSPSLREGSVFASLEEARLFLKYHPLGLAPTSDGRSLRLAEVHRDEATWRERAVVITGAELGLVSQKLPGAALELATWVEPVDYRWTLGRTVQLARI